MSTEYIILRKENCSDLSSLSEDSGDVWVERGHEIASSPARALRAMSADAGVYIAVPARSWKPLTVAVEQTTKVTIG